VTVITPNSFAPAHCLSLTVQRIAASVIDAQRRQDQDYIERAQAFAQVTAMASGSGFEALAQALAPSPVAITDAEVECGFTFTMTTEREFSIRILNASWTSRFMKADSQAHTLRVAVKRAPMMPRPDGGAASPIEFENSKQENSQ
jgi:hypothetical protein